MNEHEHEPVTGLPETLPQGEHMLWQGAPVWWPFALRALHVRLVLGYFALLMVWSLGVDLYAGIALGDALLTASRLVPVAFAAAGFLAFYAWLAQRSTVYTITNRRVVMRYGVALPRMLNLPFTVIDSAALKTYRDGTGDIPLCLDEDERVSYLMLWPHARPWCTRKPQPMLRNVPDAGAVASILGKALASVAEQRGAAESKLGVTISGRPAGAQQPAAA